MLAATSAANATIESLVLTIGRTAGHHSDTTATFGISNEWNASRPRGSRLHSIDADAAAMADDQRR